MESSGEMVVFPLLIENSYRACTIPYRFPSDNPNKPTPIELQWINLFANSIPSFKKRAESDDTVSDAPAKAEKFAQREVKTTHSFQLICFHHNKDAEHPFLLQIGYPFIPPFPNHCDGWPDSCDYRF
nr:hypothetical protein [Tanacetum cinerariifolium]